MVRNKLVSFSVLSILVLAIGYNLYLYFKPETTNLLNLKVNLQEGDKTLREIKDGKNLLIILYRSNCDYCKKETEDLHSKIDQFEDTNILFLSRESFPVIREYKKQYFPKNIDFVSFGNTDIEQLEKLADNDLVYPFIVWIDKKGVLRTQHKGVVPAENMIEVISKS